MTFLLISGRFENRTGNLIDGLRSKPGHAQLRLILTLPVVEQAGIPEPLEPGRCHLQLNRKIGRPVEPGLNYQLMSVFQSPFHPAKLRLQEFRLEQTNSIVTRKTKSFLNQQYPSGRGSEWPECDPLLAEGRERLYLLRPVYTAT